MTRNGLQNALLLSFLLFFLPACIAGGGVGMMESGTLEGSGGMARQEQTRLHGTVGTAFDFRYVRVVSGLEMAETEKKGVAESPTVQDSDAESEYGERKFLRLDVPLLSFWDEKNGFGYPGASVHRHSFDLWTRAGATYEQNGTNTFYGGGALTYYKHGAIAVSLTVDYAAEPTEFRLPLTSGGMGSSSYDGTNTGVVVGVELTIAAGEYALDIFKKLFELDERIRNDFGRY